MGTGTNQNFSDIVASIPPYDYQPTAYQGISKQQVLDLRKRICESSGCSLLQRTYHDCGGFNAVCF